MNATLKAMALKALKMLWRVLAHVLDFKPADGSVSGSMNAVESLKLVLNFVAANAAAWTFLGPKAAVVAGLATLLVKAVQLLTNEDPKVTDALAQSGQKSGFPFP